MNLKDVKIEKTFFDGKIKNIYHVTIQPEEYEICLAAANNMWCSQNKGHINSEFDQKKAERIGRIGEMAFGKMFNLPIDTEYHEYGDTMDFNYKNNKINMKCATKYPGYEAGLIKVRNNKNEKIKLKQDLYVFGYLKNENKQTKKACAVLIGYQHRDFILANKNEKFAKLGNHYNYEINYSDLLDIKEIY
jgi:hypothetical protein